MSRLVTAVRLDLAVQVRHLFPHIYLSLTLIYALLLRLTPLSQSAELVLPLMLFSEPAMLGMIFTGAHHYFEQTQGVSVAIAVTPLRVREYVVGKAVSVSILSAAAAAVLASLVLGAVDARVLGLALVVLLAASTFGLIGIGLAAHLRDFLGFVFATMGVQAVLFMAFPAVLDLAPRAWFMWLPSAPALFAMRDVMLHGARAFGHPVYWAHLGLLAAWAAIAVRWAETRYWRLVRGAPPRGRLAERRSPNDV